MRSTVSAADGGADTMTDAIYLRLKDRSSGETVELETGHHPLSDPVSQLLELDCPAGGRVLLNGQPQPHASGMAVVPDQDGECRIELLEAHDRVVARWVLTVPRRTHPGEGFLQALGVFSTEARRLPAEGTASLEQLLELPFFAPASVSASLEAPERRAFEAQLEAALPSLHQVCARPRRNLRIEHRVVPVDRVRRIPPAAFNHLASRPELWQSRTAVTLTPARILSELPEETLELYENRMVATLVKHLRRYLSRRLSEVEHACYQIDAVHAALFEGYRYNRFRNERFAHLWKEGERFHERSGDALALKGHIERLSAEVSACLDSTLCRALARSPEVGSPLKPTNILTMDPDYHRLMALWEAWEALEQRPAGLTGARVSLQDSVESYARYLQLGSLLALRWTGFGEPGAHRPAKPPPAMDNLPLLRWDDWWAALEPPQQRTGRVVLHLLRDDEEGVGGSKVPPSYLRLTLVPLPRGLHGPSSELDRDVNALFALAGKKTDRDAARRAGRRERRREAEAAPVTRAVLLAHPTDPRTRALDEEGDGGREDIPPDLVRRMLTAGENFFAPEDYHQFVIPEHPGAHGNPGHRHRPVRIGLLPISPLDLNSLERLQKLIRFYTLGRDLMDGLPPRACPVCGAPCPQPESGEVDGTCPDCEAHWSVRTCQLCGKLVPKLEPVRVKPLRDEELAAPYAVQAIAREQLLGRDQLAALCESRQVSSSGRVNVVCPHCGACPGDRLAREQCPRCSRGGWAPQ